MTKLVINIDDMLKGRVIAGGEFMKSVNKSLDVCFTEKAEERE